MVVKLGSPKQNICVVSYSYPHRTRAWMHLFTFIKLLEMSAEKLVVITGNIPKDQIPKGRFQLINFRMEPELKRNWPRLLALPVWLYNFVLGQIKTCFYLLRVAPSVDAVLFYSGADVNLVPLLLARLMGKQVMTMVVEYSPLSIKSNYGRLLAQLYHLLVAFNRRLSHRIIVYTESVIPWAGLEKYRNKVSVAGEAFINTEVFRVTKSYLERSLAIGYISRLTAEKGIMDFMAAVPLILERLGGARFLIIGDGILQQRVEEYLAKKGLSSKVDMIGWVSREQLPEYMNQLKLLVVPTHTEAGSPQVLQEVMACGTPVLATAVGGITDVIKDGENGFILEGRSPEQIAEGVIRALEYPDTSEIIKKARKLVEEEYSFKAAAERFYRVFALVGEPAGISYQEA